MPGGRIGDRSAPDIEYEKWMAGNMKETIHPAEKPVALLSRLCRLVTPPGGTVLDPFCGSGSTGKAAIAEGFNFIGIEMNAEYADIARARITDASERYT
jgi:site-specific DNA-methyltransferase (adenine-specific)